MSRPLLLVHNLCFQDCGPLSLSLFKGECVGIQGYSGVGKTQLFRAISDLICSTGEVILNGSAKDSFAATSWRSKVTMLPTDSVWWHDDVAAHFTHLGGNKKTFLEEMCEKVGLPPSIATWQVSRLSTGEKQRLALLRSLQLWPAILLLDEPTSALDSANTVLVETLLLRLCKEENLSLMWVSHDEAQLKRVSDRILIMDKSGIQEANCVLDSEV